MKNALLIIMITLANLFAGAQTTYVPDDNFEQKLIDLGYDDVLDDYVLTSNISEITELDVYYSNIQDLTGIEDFLALTYLNCGVNSLTSLDVSANTALTELNCSQNDLTSLNLSNNTALTDLYCYYNYLTSLDVSANTALTYLNCVDNSLTSLDVSGCMSLDSLDCYNNSLTNLDMTGCTALTYLRCDDNQLISLNVSGCTALTSLTCYYNQLTELDVSANTALTHLGCGDNELTSLDLSANTALEVLYCSYNELTSLDVSANTALYGLSCGGNHLTSLDMRNGNNANMGIFNSTNNPDLTCIFVDDKEASYLIYWDIDPNSTFVETEAECDALDIDDYQNVSLSKVYPNPTDGIIYIDFASENGIEKLIVSDITGKQIIEKTNVEQKSAIDLSGLKNGIYIINIQTESETFSLKIVKQ